LLEIFLYDCTNITACVNITSFQTTNSSDPTPGIFFFFFSVKIIYFFDVFPQRWGRAL